MSTTEQAPLTGDGEMINQSSHEDADLAGPGVTADLPLPVTLLVRSSRGEMVHRRGCTRARSVVPWEWAEGKSRADVKAAEVYGVRFCRVCDPLSASPTEPTPGGTR